jgi:hypothetical protein
MQKGIRLLDWIRNSRWRRLNIALILMAAALAVTTITPLLLQPEERPASPDVPDRTQTGRASTGPSFLMCDFITFGPDHELGETFAYALMDSIFKGAFRDRIRSMQRMPSDLHLPLQTDPQDRGDYFRKLQDVGSRTQATHVLEGSIDQESGTVVVHVYSCLSRRLIFMDELQLASPFDPAGNIPLIARIADDMVRSALEEMADQAGRPRPL